MTAEEAVDLYAAMLRGPVGRRYAARFANTLRGCDLVCTCPLDVPCHADVLLRLANGPDPDRMRGCRTSYSPEGPVR